MPNSADRDFDPPRRQRDTTLAMTGPSRDAEDAYWQSAYPERPYARADRGFEYYRAAYRYGMECAVRWRDRLWSDVEPELRDAWPRRPDAHATWDEVRDAIHDAWNHVRGDSADERTHIR